MGRRSGAGRTRGASPSSTTASARSRAVFLSHATLSPEHPSIYFGVQPDTLSPPVVPRPPPPPPAPSHPAGPDIATLRKEGLDACTNMNWAKCQEKLTLANRYDPAGGSDPVLSFALQQAELALTPRDGGEAPDENAKRPPPVPTGRRGPL